MGKFAFGLGIAEVPNLQSKVRIPLAGDLAPPQPNPQPPRNYCGGAKSPTNGILTFDGDLAPLLFPTQKRIVPLNVKTRSTFYFFQSTEISSLHDSLIAKFTMYVCRLVNLGDIAPLPLSQIQRSSPHTSELGQED